MFVDEVTVDIESGKGGNGCMSFRREKFVPRGGPDGGDGGKGGDVIVRSTFHYQTLNHIRNLQRFKAKNGQPGMGKKKKGANGADVIIKVPPGTMLFDPETDELLHDFESRIEDFVIAEGGRGGLGNVHFKSSTNQAPRKTTSGKPGEEIRIRLELKLLADVALVGLPNAGKSSLLTKVSRAKPRIADYPFTTLTPQLGLVRIDDVHSFTVADVPGLIEGAHQGTGLGDRFLRHIERTKFLIHLLDCSSMNFDEIKNSYHMIRKELGDYNPDLIDRDEVIVFNKIDLIEESDRLELSRVFEDTGKKVFYISALEGTGVEELVDYTGRFLINKKKELYGDIVEVPE